MRDEVRDKWEKRWHPLREEWIVYSAHRNARPWQGLERAVHKPSPPFDPDCYLCPGNPRVSGKINPNYESVYVFENDHPVVGENAPKIEQTDDHLYRKGGASGAAKVICYDPRHNVSLAQMDIDRVVKVFQAFQYETMTLARNPHVRHVLIFENRGEVTGVSNPHPHCQIYATDFVFRNVEQQLKVASTYKQMHLGNIFSDVIEHERNDIVRVIAENKSAIAFIPYFARYAYETMIFFKRAHATLLTPKDDELKDLASVCLEVIRRMDMNFNMQFPYVLSVMQAPVDGGDYPEYHMHLWLQPPYRLPGLIKYLAGPEIGGGNFMADTMPEDKAAELRSIDVSKYHPDIYHES